MERRFNRQPQLRRAYCQFIAEYQNLGHLESMPADEIDHSNANYLSHHPVIKDPDSESVRVVFNGKQKDKNDNSLNQFLHAGADLLADGRIVLLRWRFHSCVLTCDIVKMFRQFLVHPNDRV